MARFRATVQVDFEIDDEILDLYDENSDDYADFLDDRVEDALHWGSYDIKDTREVEG